MSKLGGHAMGHLPDHGEDRPLGRLAHRPVGLIGGAGQRRADQDRIDQLAGPAGEFLRGAPDQLGEDHSGIAAGPQQGGSRDRGHDLVPADLVDRAALGGARETVEFLHDGSQREHHVVARVAVGHREHVQVIDLLPTRLERRQTGLDHAANADYARVRHRRRIRGRRG
jgi:hypothetical protein